jgi:hypothetical protein
MELILTFRKFSAREHECKDYQNWQKIWVAWMIEKPRNIRMDSCINVGS